MTRWSLMVITDARVRSVEVSSSKPTVVGRGRGAQLDVDDASLAERHLVLTVRVDGLWAEPVRAAPTVLLNDVPLAGAARVQPGDELSAGATRLIVAAALPTKPSPPRVATFDELHARLEEELRRAGPSRLVGLVMVNLPGLNLAARQALTRRAVDEVLKSGAVASWAEFTPDVLAAIVPEVTEPQFSTIVGRIAAVAGPRSKVASASTPVDGGDAEAVLGAALERLSDMSHPRPPIFVDPVMVRLASLAEELSARREPVLFVGPPGVGRATLAGLACRSSPVVRSGVELNAPPTGVRELLVRDVDTMKPGALDVLLAWAADTQVQLRATAQQADPRFSDAVLVPALASRPTEIVPLAEELLAEARARLGRPRLVLGGDSRAVLATWSWPGNVRELKNVLLRAARVSLRDEVGLDALPWRLAADSPAGDFRASMRAAERQILLEALARSRWNVTAAATRLGLPRRTVVYRLKKLGLKRPPRDRAR